MISDTTFISLIQQQVGRTITPSAENEPPGQYEAICAPLNDSLFIVAGPGSGKTTVLTLKVLKLVFLDRVNPSTILVTTFTKKAAAELRSNLLRWGTLLQRAFLHSELEEDDRTWISPLDFNQIITGTLDSISETILRENRDPGNPSPTIIENFIANSIMLRYGLFEHNLHRNQNLKDYIHFLTGKPQRPTTAEITKTLIEIKDRLYHDRIHFADYYNDHSHPGIEPTCRAIQSYCEKLDEIGLYDYSKIENEFYHHLRDGLLPSLAENIRFILVDEYQDTNLLQEKIYFELASMAISNGGSISVVGDDDQSIYHFRGASVELFTLFPQRFAEAHGVTPITIYLSRNYRSTNSIVEHVRNFVTLDQDYQTVRVAEKPLIIHARSNSQINFPVIGFFREDVASLSRDLALFIHQIIHGEGVNFTYNEVNYHIAIDSERGSPNDICILCQSPQERNSNNTRYRLPGELRRHLSLLPTPIYVFNPRGQELENIEVVQQLCGLMIECLDPDNLIDNSDEYDRLPDTIKTRIRSWRNQAQILIGTNHTIVGGITLEEYVNAWQTREPIGEANFTWRRESSILELAYHLVAWIPEMQDDVEGLVYLEVILRTISQSTVFSSYKARFIYDPNNIDLEPASVKDAIWSIFVPIATGVIEINEDLLETIPCNRIPIMSIHQAKGLQFPLVIIDVGSDFSTEHHSQRFKRFPERDDKTCRVEDALRGYCELGVPTRSGINRCFDNLIRLYFVAYSRPQDLLILVGHSHVRDGYHLRRERPGADPHMIPHIATGWTRSRRWVWNRGLQRLHHYWRRP